MGQDDWADSLDDAISGWDQDQSQENEWKREFAKAANPRCLTVGSGRYCIYCSQLVTDDDQACPELADETEDK